VKVIDSFLFFNEKEIAKYRIRKLKSEVDYFVVTEIGATHTGIKRTSDSSIFFEKYIQRKIMSYKFISYKDLEKIYGNISSLIMQDPWFLEYEHRRLHDEHLRDFILEKKDIIGSKDILLFSDADEVPSLQSIEEIKRQILLNREHGRLSMSWFIGSIFFKYNENWPGSIYCTIAYFKSNNFDKILSFIHAERILNVCNVKGGNHFTYFGDAENVRNKLRSIAEAANKRVRLFRPIAVILLKLGIDPFGRVGLLTISVQSNDKSNPVSKSLKPYNFLVRIIFKPIVLALLYIFAFIVNSLTKVSPNRWTENR
jgi:hypothetical protein